MEFAAEQFPLGPPEQSNSQESEREQAEAEVPATEVANTAAAMPMSSQEAVQQYVAEPTQHATAPPAEVGPIATTPTSRARSQSTKRGQNKLTDTK